MVNFPEPKTYIRIDPWTAGQGQEWVEAFKALCEEHLGALEGSFLEYFRDEEKGNDTYIIYDTDSLSAASLADAWPQDIVEECRAGTCPGIPPFRIAYGALVEKNVLALPEHPLLICHWW